MVKIFHLLVKIFLFIADNIAVGELSVADWSVAVVKNIHKIFILRWFVIYDNLGVTL